MQQPSKPVDVAELVRAATSALQANPHDPKALTFLGVHAAKLGDFAKAEPLLRKALQADPASESARKWLTEVCLQQQGAAHMERFESRAAIQCAEQILQQNPRAIRARLLLSRALLAEQQGDPAWAAISQVLQQTPEWPLATLTAGRIAVATGRFQEAEALFQRTIKLNPKSGQGYLGIVQSRRIGPEDSELVRQMTQLARTGNLIPEELRSLHFALGKALDDLGYYERAMEHFDEANRIEFALRFGSQPFDREAYAKQTDLTISLFDSQTMARHASPGSQEQTPIFVVGMMRSGTTLTDQILSCHPEVASAGEQSFWSANQASASQLDAAKLSRLALDYLAIVSQHRQGQPRVVDKYPGNYAALGLIHLALPNARIVHVTRHPVDTCISIYTTPNAAGLPWTYNKADIVFVYKEYLRLMAHWRSILPPAQMLEIRYEDLVSDPQNTTRKLVEFCGLRWNDSCLRPEKHERAVITPSAWQVRQAIHTGSVARWQNYEPWLNEFRELL